MRENRKYFGLRGERGSVVGAEKLVGKFLLPDAFTSLQTMPNASLIHQLAKPTKIHQLKIPNSNEKIVKRHELKSIFLLKQMIEKSFNYQKTHEMKVY
jgi:hypothetical protein